MKDCLWLLLTINSCPGPMVQLLESLHSMEIKTGPVTYEVIRTSWLRIYNENPLSMQGVHSEVFTQLLASKIAPRSGNLTRLEVDLVPLSEHRNPTKDDLVKEITDMRLETVLSLPLYTELIIEAIQLDVNNPKRLIAILGSAVLSVHISGQHEALIGNITVSGYQEGDADLALFKFPKGLYQWGTDALIIADTGNYCLRLLNYSTGRITELAGRCTVPDQRNTANRDQIGHRNSFKDIRFMEPTVITEDIYEENNIYMIDHQEVLRINLAERLIKKHKESQYHLQGLMVLHGIVFASVENGVIKMSTQETPEEFILGSSSEMNDNEAFHIRFENPKAIAFTTDNLLLIADSGTNGLRLFDYETGSVRALCTGSAKGSPRKKDGNTQECGFANPTSIFIANITGRLVIFVGEAGTYSGGVRAFRTVYEAVNVPKGKGGVILLAVMAILVGSGVLLVVVARSYAAKVAMQEETALKNYQKELNSPDDAISKNQKAIIRRMTGVMEEEEMDEPGKEDDISSISQISDSIVPDAILLTKFSVSAPLTNFLDTKGDSTLSNQQMVPPPESHDEDIGLRSATKCPSSNQLNNILPMSDLKQEDPSPLGEGPVTNGRSLVNLVLSDRMIVESVADGYQITDAERESGSIMQSNNLMVLPSLESTTFPSPSRQDTMAQKEMISADQLPNQSSDTQPIRPLESLSYSTNPPSPIERIEDSPNETRKSSSGVSLIRDDITHASIWIMETEV